MLSSLRRRFSHRRDIPQSLWEAQRNALPWLGHWDTRELESLRALCARFLAEKSMTGAAGLLLTAPMQLHIAAQACVPILRLGLRWYRGWSGIVVYPASFRVQRQIQEPGGLVQPFDAELAGEAWDGGPVVLSWEDAAADLDGKRAQSQEAGGGNVVIHEFAHKLDWLNGAADGTPPFDPRLHPGLGRERWQDALEDAFERFCAELELVDSELPANVDPDSTAARRYYAHLPLDPYAATDTAEFFAVSSEAFFLDPAPLAAAFPQWHDMLRRFYRPEPAPDQRT